MPRLSAALMFAFYVSLKREMSAERHEYPEPSLSYYEKVHEALSMSKKCMCSPNFNRSMKDVVLKALEETRDILSKDFPNSNIYASAAGVSELMEISAKARSGGGLFVNKESILTSPETESVARLGHLASNFIVLKLGLDLIATNKANPRIISLWVLALEREVAAECSRWVKQVEHSSVPSTLCLWKDRTNKKE